MKDNFEDETICQMQERKEREDAEGRHAESHYHSLVENYEARKAGTLIRHYHRREHRNRHFMDEAK